MKHYIYASDKPGESEARVRIEALRAAINTGAYIAPEVMIAILGLTESGDEEDEEEPWDI